VIDIPCGEGFGSAILAESAELVMGMDISVEAVTYAKEKYRHTNLRFEVAELAEIPVEDGQIGLIVCLEGIEHVDEVTQARALSEFRRVLAPEGVLIISSPNRYVYSDLPGTSNPFHVHEFYSEEFREFLSTQFQHLYMFGQNSQDGSLIFPIGTSRKSHVTFLTPSSSDFDEFAETANDADVFKYQICVCANQGVDDLLLSARVTVDVHQGIAEMRASALQDELRGLGVERDALQVERDALQADRDALKVERDALQVERDALNGELAGMLLRAASRLQGALREFPLAENLVRRSLRHFRSMTNLTSTRRPRF
jgi:hypothetical protein